MANLFDYISWRGDLYFTQSPLNPVDYVVLSQLSYFPFDGIVPGPEETGGVQFKAAGSILLERIKNDASVQKTLFMFKEDPDFLKALVSSNRFGNCCLMGYVNQIDTEKEIQFSAICIHTGDGSCSVIFRGTDTSFVGWKEDLNMTFKETIPAQQEAVKYLEKMASLTSGPLRVSGHSKGGNLAVYAASFCDRKTQMRITDIFNFDAPGFHEKTISSEGYCAIKDKIRSYIPQSSVIGLFLEQGSNYSVVKSTQLGIFQHSLFSWEVTHNDMVYLDDVTLSSRFVDKTLSEWIGSIDNDHREKFIEAMYAIINASEAKTLQELESTWFMSMGKIIRSLTSIDEPTKKIFMKAFIQLIRSARRNIETFLINKNDEQET